MFRLLATGRLTFSNLPTLMKVLPNSLAAIELQFAAIAPAFEIKLYNPDEDKLVYVSVVSPVFWLASPK